MALLREGQDNGVVPVASASPLSWVERHRYQPSGSNRLFGIAGTTTICVLALAGLMITFSRAAAPHAASAPMVVAFLPLASPPATPPKVKEAPRPIEKKERPSEVQKVPLVDRTIMPDAHVAAPVPVATPRPVDPAPRSPETAAPRTIVAPPAPQASSNAADSWEGRVLARLNQHRRYPAKAQMRRQQGVPYIRFVMNRDGKVLSSRIERSSGFPELDREAVALPKRSQPLPKPPADKAGDAIELVVPVEFFMR